MRFDKKTVLVTGASVGIGRACAIRFCAEGANVVALDINEESLRMLEKEITADGGHILTIVCDVSDKQAVDQAFEKAKAHFGSVDILVNNAALWRSWSSFLDTPLEVWEQYININVMGCVYCIHAALPDMIKAGYGRIINVASVAGVYGNANMVPYSTTKGGLIAMTRALAKEVADKGILVNAVSPGTVSPSNVADLDSVQKNALNYMGRTGSDNENAALICFLAGDEASYISGQNHLIDGCRKSI